jgi:putative SOS response-associated peptidase YedK
LESPTDRALLRARYQGPRPLPVILEAQDFEQWERGDVKDAAALMKPAGEDVLQKWPVSKRVNSSRTSDEDATLIEPITLAV